MGIKKKRRVSIRIDMTPMVDIAFLLLIFYMATTQFKPPEARAVELPKSHSQIELPDKDIINITVTKQDSIYVDYIEKVKMNLDGQDVETTGRRVRTTDAYGVANEINRARAKNYQGAGRHQRRPRSLIRHHAGGDETDAGEQPRAVPHYHG